MIMIYEKGKTIIYVFKKTEDDCIKFCFVFYSHRYLPNCGDWNTIINNVFLCISSLKTAQFLIFI